MSIYADFPNQLIRPFPENGVTDHDWSYIDHLLPSIQCCGVDKYGLFIALFLNGGFVQLCDVSCGLIIPQTHFMLPNGDKSICHSIVWSTDAKHLIVSLSKRTKSISGVGDHELVVWDVLGGKVAQRFTLLFPLKKLESMHNSNQFLCRISGTNSFSIAILDVSTSSLHVLTSVDGAFCLKAQAWLASHDVTAFSAATEYPIHAYALCELNSGQSDIYIVACKPGAAHVTLSMLTMSNDLLIEETAAMPLDLLKRESITLTQGHHTLCLCAPAAQMCLLYHIDHEKQLLVLKQQLPGTFMPKDSNCLSAGMVSIQQQPYAVICTQQQNRHSPSVRVLIFSPESSKPVVVRSVGVALHSVWICDARSMIFGLDSQGKVRSLYFGVKSDFAGAMYPIGYTLVHRIRNYDEREDELDEVLELCEPALVKEVAVGASTGPVSSLQGEEEAWLDLLPTPTSRQPVPADYLQCVPYASLPLSRTELRMATPSHLNKKLMAKANKLAAVVPSTSPALASSAVSSHDASTAMDIVNPDGETAGANDEAEGDGEEDDAASATTMTRTALTSIGTGKSVFPFDLQALLPMPSRVQSGDFMSNFSRKLQSGTTIHQSCTPEVMSRRFEEFLPNCIEIIVKEAVRAEKRKLVTAERRQERKKQRDTALLSVFSTLQAQQQERERNERELIEKRRNDGEVRVVMLRLVQAVLDRAMAELEQSATEVLHSSHSASELSAIKSPLSIAVVGTGALVCEGENTNCTLVEAEAQGVDLLATPAEAPCAGGSDVGQLDCANRVDEMVKTQSRSTVPELSTAISMSGDEGLPEPGAAPAQTPAQPTSLLDLEGSTLDGIVESAHTSAEETTSQGHPTQVSPSLSPAPLGTLTDSVISQTQPMDVDPQQQQTLTPHDNREPELEHSSDVEASTSLYPVEGM